MNPLPVPHPLEYSLSASGTFQLSGWEWVKVEAAQEEEDSDPKVAGTFKPTSIRFDDLDLTVHSFGFFGVPTQVARGAYCLNEGGGQTLKWWKK